MKKIAIAFAALLLLIGFASWNVWRAVYEPVTTTPSLVDQGRQQLHAQLEQAQAREADIEKMDWDSIPLLRELIQSHQHRIDQLKDNSQASEILTHDRDAIVRLEKRIADLQAQQAAQPPAATDETQPTSTSQPSEPATITPHPQPVAPAHPAARPPAAQSAPQTTKPAQKTQSQPASSKPAPQPPPTTR